MSMISGNLFEQVIENVKKWARINSPWLIILIAAHAMAVI